MLSGYNNILPFLDLLSISVTFNLLVLPALTIHELELQDKNQTTLENSNLN